MLDAALSWRPNDPLGWLGQAEDAEGAVLAREKNSCSFGLFAQKLRKSLKRLVRGVLLNNVESFEVISMYFKPFQSISSHVK